MEPNIGRRIQLFRRRKGLTQEELASILGISRATLARWETGVRKPSSSWILKLAEVLDVSPAQLFEFQGKEEVEDLAELLIKKALKEENLPHKDEEAMKRLKPLVIKKLEALKEELKWFILLEITSRKPDPE